jgi:hypothetical protein
MKLSALLALSLLAAPAFGQQSSRDDQGAFTPVSLASEFFEHDFFNFYAFGSGIFDTYAPIINQQGQSVNNGGFGWEVGGGVNGYHQFHDATLSLSYSGGYREYQTSAFSSGADQNLSLAYSKRLSRRWSFSTGVGAGMFLYGGTFFSLQPNQPNVIASNPFSPETKFLSSGIGLTYQQTRRLSYSLGGSFFLQRYNYPGTIGTTGGSGSASAGYRVTSRTSVGASYSHAYYTYQRNSGQAEVDSFAGSISHVFHSHWFASFSAGLTRSNISGTVFVPVTLLVGTQAVGGYVPGQYSQIAHFPSFSGSVSHSYRRTTIGGSAGQGIVSGNGYFLASKSQFLSGVASYSFRKSNVSIGGSYSRLSSVANSVSSQYSSGSIGANYGMMLMHYVGSFLRYEYVYYGNLNPYPGVSDNRFSFGLSFSSKSIPMTLY